MTATIFTKEERRQRREARRQKQREQNVHRAKKMHQRRLELPTSSLAESGAKPADGVYVGCSGWYYWHWGNGLYKDVPRPQWFQHYAKHFSTVELNAPFYSWPTLATVKNWIKQAEGKRFIYTVKVSELITHTKRFTGTKTLVKDFGLIADLLGPYMGCFLFQLPPSYHYTPARLRTILSQLEPGRRNVVEFRHKSWWNDRVYKAFHETGIIFCSCSGPRLPDELVQTADDIYIRFHGTKRWYLHDYTSEELAVWAERAQQSGAKRVWAYFNNDRNGYAIKNAEELRRQLSV